MVDVQDIYLESNEDGNSYALTSTNVQVHLGETHVSSRDSSLVKSTSLVEYRWEANAYKGNLVAVNREGSFVAYILQGPKGSAVRVYHKQTKQRGLIKRLEGQATDVAWAYCVRPLFLGVADEGGNFYVHQVGLGKQELTIVKYFHLHRPDASPGMHYRLTWCPFMMDDPANISTGDGNAALHSDDVIALNGAAAAGSSASAATPNAMGSLRSYGLLAVAHGHAVDVLDVEALIENHGRDVNIDACRFGLANIRSKGEILAMAMSPDATALAVASTAGDVVFYIMESLNDIREAHHWVPHKGKPVTSICFLDDITMMEKDTHFWKFALTASDNNRELKIFNCENWTCINTLRIGDSNPMDPNSPTPIVISLDWTAGFIVMSDIDRKSLYVVQITQDQEMAKFVAFSEFPLVQPALSLAVVQASMKRFRPFSPGAAFEFADKEYSYVGEEHGKVTGVRVMLYAVNPRSLLELEVRYQPKIFSGGESHFESSTPSLADSFQDRLSDMSSTESAMLPVSMPPTELSLPDSADTEAADVNSPTDSTTPVDEKRDDELVQEHHNSNSPDSEEVRSILLNSAVCDSSDLVLSSQTDDVTSVKSQSEEKKFMTCAVKVERARSHPEMERQNSIGQELCFRLESERNFSPLQQPLTPGPKQNNEAATVVQVELIDSMMKLKEQTSAMLDYMKQQEFEMRNLKLELTERNDVLRQVTDLILNAEQQMETSGKVLKEIQSQYRSFDPEAMKDQLARTLVHSVRHNMETCVRQEIQTCVNTVMQDFTPRIEQILHRDLERITATLDTNLSRSCAELVKSQPVLDTLGAACGRAVGDQVLVAFKQSFQSTVAPSFEKVIAGAFGQLNDMFRQGTAEFAEQLQRQATASRNDMEQTKASLNVVVDQFRASLQEQKTSSKKLDQTIRDAIKDETKRAFADNQTHLSDVIAKSQTVTPEVAHSPQVERQNLQNEVAALLQKQAYAEAFQKALNALDLNLVLFACGKIGPTDLFAINPCPLTQPVILSLIQQLSNDLAVQTDLKLKYLMEAVLSIDSKSNASSQQQSNVNRVISQLERKLDAFTKDAVASTPFTRQIKMLAMAAQSLTK